MLPDLALDLLDSLADRSSRRGTSEVWLAEDVGVEVAEVERVLLELANNDLVRLRAGTYALAGWYLTEAGWLVLTATT